MKRTLMTAVGVAALAVIGLAAVTAASQHPATATGHECHGANPWCPTPTPTTPTPTPTSTPTTTPPPGSCTSAPNTPDGPDPYGGCFPGPGNTGVPAGTVLTDYTGPSDIATCGTVIDSKTITTNLTVSASNGTRSAATPCVTIKNSLITAMVATSSYLSGSGPLLLQDDEINAPTTTTDWTLRSSNFYAYRLNVHGGAAGAINCSGNCEIHDSWTHDMYFAGGTHYDGIISNGLYGNPMLVDHSSVGCNFYAGSGTGGCSADLGLFGDFSPIAHVTVNHNLFLPSVPPNSAGAIGYCMYGGSQSNKAYPTATYVVVTGNVFERGGTGKCGDYGPVAAWAFNTGNVWSGNTWDDGTPLTP